MNNISYKVLNNSIIVLYLCLFVVFILTIRNIDSNNYSDDLKKIIDKITSSLDTDDICKIKNMDSLCQVKNNLDKVDKDRNNLHKSSMGGIIDCISFFFFIYIITPQQFFSIKNPKKGYESMTFKILCLLGIAAGVYYVVDSYNKTRNANNELKISKSALKSYKSTPLPENKSAKAIIVELESTLDKYDKELESFLTYSYIIIGINSVALLLILIYAVKCLLNHKK